ncbi:hypothetical protein FBEOM_2342 [Fusarium beomiforme]|uniref:GPI-Mannosyltransferase II co-activator n=1 Tax=Fusarium beomiforme TaxID=44412 RepID=A0A9P5AS04_9HYPO|nr:hypothetical protein FBEOM_2342 [Fusarium beomiforme]
MLSYQGDQMIYALCGLLLLLTPAIANVEKTIFTAPPSFPIPHQKPSLADLRLRVLTPVASSIRTNISRIFPTGPQNYTSGAATWLLLDKLNQGQRYEFRVCWAAIPTGFELAVHELNTVWQSPELIQSLASYAFSRHDQETEFQREEPHDGGKEREASVLLLQIKASADYFTDEVVFMRDPSPVLVDLILDPYLYGVVPLSLVPTVGYIVLIGVVAWFVSRFIACKLQTIAVTTDGANKKKE